MNELFETANEIYSRIINSGDETVSYSKCVEIAATHIQTATLKDLLIKAFVISERDKYPSALESIAMDLNKGLKH